MSRPIAVCLEDLRPPSPDRRYLRCTALVGRAPGLRLDEAGDVRWQADGPPTCELWVSADERLILYRPEGCAPVVVRRAHRSLDVPAEKPVVLLDKDELELGARRLRVHVHGSAPRVQAPEFLRPVVPRVASKAAAALALGAALGAAGCRKDPPPPPDAGTPPEDAGARTDAGDPQAESADALDVEPEIEIRVTPPAVPPSMVEPADAEAPAPSVVPDAAVEPAEAAPAEPEDVAAAEDARRPRRDAVRPPPPEIEVRDQPPFVEK